MRQPRSLNCRSSGLLEQCRELKRRRLAVLKWKFYRRRSVTVGVIRQETKRTGNGCNFSSFRNDVPQSKA